MLRYGIKCDLLNTPGPYARLVAADVAEFVNDIARTPFCGLRICFHNWFGRGPIYSCLVIEYSLDVRGEGSAASYARRWNAIAGWDCRRLSRCRMKGFCSASPSILVGVYFCFFEPVFKGVTAISGCHDVQYSSESGGKPAIIKGFGVQVKRLT